MTRPRNKHPSNDAIWNACREARDADAARTAQADARVEAAATRLGFTQKNQDERFERECPHCARRVALFANKNGNVYASASDTGSTCPAIPNLQQWLRDNGFQS